MKKKSLHILVVPIVSILSIVLMSFAFLNALNESISRQDEIVFSEPEISKKPILITGRVITSTTTSKCLKPNPMNYNWLPSQYQPYSCDYAHEYSDGLTFQQCCSQGPNCWCANNDMAATYTDPNCNSIQSCILRYYCKTPQNKYPCNGADPTATPQISCTDSDNGQNPAVKGTASGTGSNGPATREDSCSNANTVFEAFCSPTYGPTKVDITCSSGTQCVDGACVGLDLQASSFVFKQNGQQVSPNNLQNNVDLDGFIIVNYNGQSQTIEIGIGVDGPTSTTTKTVATGQSNVQIWGGAYSTGMPFSAGSHTLTVILDPNNKIQESNENNNQINLPFTVVAPQQQTSGVPGTQGQQPGTPTTPQPVAPAPTPPTQPAPQPTSPKQSPPSGVAPTSPAYTAPSVSYTQPRSASPRQTSSRYTSPKPSMPSVSTPPINTLPAPKQLPGRLEPCEITIGCSSNLNCRAIKAKTKGVCLDKVTEESFKRFMENFEITIPLT